MLSTRKFLLSLAEYVALAVSVCTIALAISVAVSQSVLPTIANLLVPLWIATFVPFLVSVILTSEFVRAFRNVGAGWQKHEGLSSKELSALVRWSPTGYKAAAVLAVAIGVFTALAIGGVEWSSTEPFTKHHALGFMLYSSVFALLSLPVLASATRMPGSFQDNFTAYS